MLKNMKTKIKITEEEKEEEDKKCNINKKEILWDNKNLNKDLAKKN